MQFPAAKWKRRLAPRLTLLAAALVATALHPPSPPSAAADDPAAASFLSAGDHAARPYNGAAYVSLRAANVFSARDQSRSTPFAEMTLGAFATGTERTSGRVEAEFVPGSQPALVHFRFQGQSSNDDGVARHQRRDVVIHSTSLSSVDVRQPVRLDEQGLTLLPIEGCVNTDMRVQCVDASRPIVRWLARRQVRKQHAEAESIKSGKLRDQVSEELRQEVAKQLNPAQETYTEKVRGMLQSRGAFPRLLETSARAERLELRLLHQNPDQLAPPERPSAIAGDLDLAIVAHESLLGNIAESMWGGRTMQDQQILDFLKVLTGRPPRELWVHDRTPRWSMTLADRLPLTGRFRDDRMRLVLRCKAATRGAETLQADFEAAASYELFITPDGPRLVREGELTFRFADDQPDDAARSDWRAFLTRKLGGIFQEELNFDGLTPPAGGAGDKLRRFQLAALGSNHEWIRIGYRLTDKPQAQGDAPAVDKAPPASRRPSPAEQGPAEQGPAEQGPAEQIAG